MPPSDEYPEPAGVPPLLTATLHMEEAFQGLRRDLLSPFDQPPPSADYYAIWHDHEARSRPGCEQAILYWIGHRKLPNMADDAAFFLCRRFDQASEFAQNLFLKDQTTVFSHVGVALDAVLWWLLVDWWEEHGCREAFFHDLEEFES